MSFPPLPPPSPRAQRPVAAAGLRGLAAAALALAACAEPARPSAPSASSVEAPASAGTSGESRERGASAVGTGPAAADPAAAPAAAPGDVPPALDLGPPPETDKLALLVGIDRYAPGTPPGFPELRGCVNDVESVRAVLVERFGFDPGAVLVLTDERATHANLVRAFREWLIAGSGPDTQAVLWYSGHGSRIPDRSAVEGAEADGLESSLVAYDSRVGGADGAYDVSDDELHSLLAALAERTPWITVVTDACHSGAAVRGAALDVAGTRAAPPGTRALDRDRIAAFWPADVPFLDDGDRRRLAPERYVHVAACSPRQVAREISVREDGDDGEGAARHHGALTYFLLGALHEARPGARYRELADRASVRLSTRFPGQTVWYEGALERELFERRFDAPPDGFLARPLPTGELEVGAGRLHGLTPGSELAVFDAAQETELGRAEVFRVRTASSFARWSDRPRRDGVELEPDALDALRAVEVGRGRDREPLPLAAAEPWLAELVAASPWARPVDAGAAEPCYRVEAEGERLVLVSPEGLRLYTDPEPAGGDPRERARAELERLLRDERRHRELFELGGEPGELALRARFVPPSDAELRQHAARGFAAAELGAAGDGRAAGSVYRAARGSAGPDARLLAVLEVENASGEELYVSVLSVAEERSRNLIFPVGSRRDNHFAPGHVERILIEVLIDPGWSLPRPMRDRYLVIGTRTEADFGPLVSRARLRGGGSAGLPPVLESALRAPRTRGGGPASDAHAFGLAVVDLLVEAPRERPVR